MRPLPPGSPRLRHMLDAGVSADVATRSAVLHSCVTANGAEHAEDRLKATASASEAAIDAAEPRPSMRRLRIESPCALSCVRSAEPRWDWNTGRLDHEAWEGFCACCKRPLVISLEDTGSINEVAVEREAKRRRAAEGSPRYAFVIGLWGSSAEYVLGAIVLGRSLLRTGTAHDLVVLHTDDVPDAAVDILRRVGWKIQRVEHVEASDALFRPGITKVIFAKVFTKLRVLGLVEYAKVAMLDVDLLVHTNIDDLFDLPTPAAMTRGPRVGYRHGERIDGKRFFGGGWSEPSYGTWGNSWGQSSGINAGVMVLEPDLKVLEQCLAEVRDPKHPEHIQGNGPEQDYLSRFYASDWHHIDVAYNFQLHQMFFTLHPVNVGHADRTRFLRKPELVKISHYSGYLKPWKRFTNEDFKVLGADEWNREVQTSFSGYKAWVMRDPDCLQKEADHDGLISNARGNFERPGDPGAIGRAEAAAEEHGVEGRRRAAFLAEGVIKVEEFAKRGCDEVMRRAYDEWEVVYREAAKELEEVDLSVAVVKACERSPQGHVEAASKPASSAHAWQCAPGGWWVERSDGERAVAFCATLPSPHAALSLSGVALLTAEGEGVHVAAVGSQAPAARSLGFSDAEAAKSWAEAVPKGATVLLAIIDHHGASAEVLTALAEGGLGCPAASLPGGCCVAAAVGEKGSAASWHTTHAAADAAMARGIARGSMPLPAGSGM